MKRSIAAVALGVSVVSAAFGADAAADYSILSNPNGVWSYGWSSTLTGSLNLDTDNSEVIGPVVAWTGDIGAAGDPGVFKNTSGSTYHWSSATFFPYQMIMHPGPDGEYSVVRYLAPSTGTFDVSASFIGQDGTTTDVHLLKNGIDLFDGAINGYGSTAGTSELLNLTAGDTLDIRVGFGSNQSYTSDSTGANLTVQSVPTPSSGLCLGLAVISLARRRKLKRQPASI